MASAHGSRVVAIDEILGVECDIFAPCALGGVISRDTVGVLNCKAVVGSANNQLATDAQAEQLAGRGIVYVPDFVANAGGIINIANEVNGYDWTRAATAIDRIHDNTTRVLETAALRSINPNAAALEVAKERIESIGSIKLRRRGHTSR